MDKKTGLTEAVARRRFGIIALVFFVLAVVRRDLMFSLEPYAHFVDALPDLLERVENPVWWIGLCLAGLAVAHRMTPWKALGELGLSVSPLRPLAVSFVACSPMLIGFAIFAPLNDEFTIRDALLYSGIFPFAEEVLFRGYAFGQFYRRAKLNLWVAAAAVGFVFGALHLGNASVQNLPLSGEIGTVAIISIGGVLYAWLYAKWDNNLWVPFGMHLFMNLWWDVFNVAESPLGGWFPNAMRLLTVILIIVLTIYRDRLPLLKATTDEPVSA